MRKINSIGFGPQIIGLIALFTTAIPLVLKLFLWLTSQPAFKTLFNLSLWVGLVLFFLFLLILFAEFIQDKRIAKGYASLRKSRLSLGNGHYECQNCGNRLLFETSRSCGLCGVRFIFERSASDESNT